MAKDKRYTAVKSLIETGGIKSFREIFDYIPRKVVYADLGMNYSRFKRLLDHPDLFSIRELSTFANFLGIEARKIIELAHQQTELDKKTKRRGK